MSDLPEYTIRVKPQIKESGAGDAYTFGGPTVALVDAAGNEVGRLVGIGGVSLDLDEEMFANVNLRMVLFEWERAETVFGKGRPRDEGAAD